MAANDSYNLQGQNGGILIKSGGTTASFDSVTMNDGRAGRGFLVTADAVLDAIASNIDNDSDLIGDTLKAGLYFPGAITSLELASGSVVVVK